GRAGLGGGLESSVLRTRQDGRWHECVTGSPCADQHLLRVRSYDLDRIRMELPGTSVERFERSRRRLGGLRSAFRVTDVNSPLQALKRVSVGAEHDTRTSHASLTARSNYDEYRGRILIWVKKATGGLPRRCSRQESRSPASPSAVCARAESGPVTARSSSRAA